MNVRSLAVSLVLAALAILSGCATVPMASPEKDMQAKTFAVKPDKSTIYIYRNERLEQR